MNRSSGLGINNTTGEAGDERGSVASLTGSGQHDGLTKSDMIVQQHHRLPGFIVAVAMGGFSF
ncbi:MAG: hypothetical protein SV201_14400 [Pseudomonadota bacterium]|nr:hypothetical protein [Pseudomonadota bacterium]